MELWFTENHTNNVRFSIKIEKQLHSSQSDFQRIDVFQSAEYGKILVLDGYLMITEKDEFIYHEMITHMPMATNPDIKRVLVIGAGDGGTVNQLTRYETIQHIDMVEIDEQVVKVCRKHFPKLTAGLDDERVTIHYKDGLKFVRNCKDEYDLIIVDSTDPFGPGEGLFTKEFYGNCYNALTENGILVNQHESVYYSEYERAMKRAHSRISDLFPICRVYQAHIPTYPSGHWLFGFASKKYDPLCDLNSDKWNALNIKTRYYNTKLHIGSFAVPNYVLEALGDE